MSGRSNDSSAAYKGVAVTKSDATILPTTRALYIGGAGDVAVVWADGGSAVTLTGLLAGMIYPFQVKMVMSTNTTATSIVALY